MMMSLIALQRSTVGRSSNGYAIACSYRSCPTTFVVPGRLMENMKVQVKHASKQWNGANIHETKCQQT